MKIGVGILYKKLSTKYEFHKGQRTKDIHYLRAKINNYPTFCTLSDLNQIQYTESEHEAVQCF